MNTYRYILLLIILVINYNCDEINQTGISTNAKNAIDTLFNVLDNNRSPSCLIGILFNGKIIYEKAWGMSDIEKGKFATNTSSYYVGSIGKQFVGFLICLRYLQNKVDINSSITLYLKDLPAIYKPVLISDLLYHSSGIPDYEKEWLKKKDKNAPVKSPINVYDFLRGLNQLSFKPGEKYEYSNSNYFLLGRVIEKIDNAKLGKIMINVLFDKLGMENSFYVDTHPNKIQSTAPSYFINSDGKYERAPFKQELVGAGGLFTTLSDLGKWDYNYFYNVIGDKPKELISLWEKSGKLRNGESTHYAAGIIPWKHKGDKILVHEGGYYAYRAVILRYVKRKVTIVVLSNFSDIKAGETAYKVGDIIFRKN